MKTNNSTNKIQNYVSWNSVWVSGTSQIITHWFWSIPTNIKFVGNYNNDLEDVIYWEWNTPNTETCIGSFYSTTSSHCIANSSDSIYATISNVTINKFTLTWVWDWTKFNYIWKIEY